MVTKSTPKASTTEDHTIPPTPPHPDTEFFADGVANLWVRSSVLKVELYQALAPSV